MSQDQLQPPRDTRETEPEAPPGIAGDARLERIWRALSEPVAPELPGEGAARVARVMASVRADARRRERFGSLYPMPLRLAAVAAPVVGLVLGLQITTRVERPLPSEVVSEVVASEVVASAVGAGEIAAGETPEGESSGQRAVEPPTSPSSTQAMAGDERIELPEEPVDAATAEAVGEAEDLALWEGDVGLVPPLLAELYLRDVYSDETSSDGVFDAEAEAGEVLR